MNEQNLNNTIVIDRISKKVLNEPNIEIDEEVYAEAVSRLVEKFIGRIKAWQEYKETNPKECVFTSRAKRKIN